MPHFVDAQDAFLLHELKII